MSIPHSCYNLSIGLSRTECTCYDTYKPVDYNTSLSGLYLDELEPLDKLIALNNCENTSMWNAMDIARENSIMIFIAESNARMLKEYDLIRNTFKGGIGNAKWYMNKPFIQNYGGVLFRSQNVKSGTLKINKIGTIFSDTGTITLFIYNNLNELIDTLTLNKTANLHTQNIVSIDLPLHSDYTENLIYYFVYAKTDGIPKNNDYSCACGRHTHRKYDWENWISVSGFEDNDLDFMENEIIGYESPYMNGLTFEVEFRCAIGDVFCKDGWDIDYTGDPIAASIAHYIWYKAAEYCLRKIMTSTDINRPTMMQGEMMEKFMIDYKTKAEEMMIYIVTNANLGKTDCIKCKNKIGMAYHNLI
jgi:hypothetical protein